MTDRGGAFHPVIELMAARLREFLREPEAVFWLVFFPVLLAFALGLAFSGRGEQQVHVGVEDTGKCSFCGGTLRDFRASGRLGCAHCYEAFEKSMRELLRRVHGNSRHVGRRYEPPNASEMERAGTVAELRERLRRAIDGEQFELAATLRDQLKGLE